MAQLDFAAITFLSESTPALEITRVISDQMQVSSLVEKNMYLRSYEGKQKNNKAKIWFVGLKSPSRRQAGKVIGSELSSFDYVIRTGAKSNSLNAMNGRTFTSPRGLGKHQEMMGENGSHQRISTVGSNITAATTASTSSSLDSSVIISTSSLSIPTICRPNKVTSTLQKNKRKNKVKKAIEANNKSRSFNFAVSMENGGMGQSPQRNKVQGKRRSNESPHSLNDYQTTSTAFDPFGTDNETENKMSF